LLRESKNEIDLEKFEGVGGHTTFAGQTEADLFPVGGSGGRVSVEELGLGLRLRH